RVVFVFPGQGHQWVGMAVGLLDSSVVFAERLAEVNEVLGGLVDWDLFDVLRGVEGAPGLDRVDVVQPVLFGVMVGLAGLWGACGVVPDAVVGHSQGEIAAACVAGLLSLEDAVRVVVLRSRELLVLAGSGGMVSVGLGVGGVEELLVGFGGRLSVAVVNGPGSVVVAGDVGALDEFVKVCEGVGVRWWRVAVDYASHCGHVEVVEEGLLRVLGGVVGRDGGGVGFYSTVTGGLLGGGELSGGYWYRNLRERVRFDEAVGAVLGEGGRVHFVEVSCHPVMVEGVLSVAEGLGVGGLVGVSGSLRRGEGGAGRFVGSLGEAWVGGVGVDWGAVVGVAPGSVSGGGRVELPTYAFDRKRYWIG
ncbi:acyltransferase domain-containing protein, partial [Streptomyces sp. NPDC006798]|uniref:acyltransferase domain-containing protein n=1 Tax=Streptomyces sp. NPDC006798 TaxID=3155462 RepID=UPI0033CADB82